MIYHEGILIEISQLQKRQILLISTYMRNRQIHKDRK